MAAVCSGGIYTGFASVGYTKVAVLGVVQGLTRATADTPRRPICAWCLRCLGGRTPGSAFSAIMQLAALVAVVSYFWKDVEAVASGAISAATERRWNTPDSSRCGHRSGHITDRSRRTGVIANPERVCHTDTWPKGNWRRLSFDGPSPSTCEDPMPTHAQG